MVNIMSCCLIVCFYAGQRRNQQEKHYEDYIRLQKEYLKKVKQSVDKIIFVISKDNQQDFRFETIENITYFYRPNGNLSFDGILQFPTFDYYILLEDDYFFVKDNYDKILIQQYKKKNCSYLTTWRNAKDKTRFKGELISTIGIISFENFQKCDYNKFKVVNKDKGGAMYNFLIMFDTIGCLDYEYNFFPYWSSEKEIMYFGYDSNKTKKENQKRAIISCYQYLFQIE